MTNGRNSERRRRQPRIYEDGTNPKPTTQEQETNVAGALGGRPQPGSGSSDYAKGDVKQGESAADFQSNRFLIECKQTIHASLRIEGKWLAKITREAAQAGREPALEFEIHGCDDPMLEREWVAVPMSVFRRLIDTGEDEDDGH